ncbi:ATP-dependent Clp protease ATP-binding subunit, partial [Enterococcus faecalis]|nr:ATP-dependent Clp protease ATP-binding subunit [Enterococcus faecalis]
SQMGSSDIERLKDMAHRLESKVIGQDKAVEAVAKAIRRNRAGFDDGRRPIGSFLFVGPTGVGKTELAKQLALDMFGSKDAIIRLDMSE